MNHLDAYKTLEHLLTNPEAMNGDVLALTGPWGCGKTHLWRTLKQRYGTHATISKALYASIFGVDTVDEIKQRLLQSALKNGDKTQWDVAKHGLKALSGLVPRGQQVLAALPHAMSPFILQNRLLVLDDIERKGKKMEADALLGFVDEMRTRFECRVLLLFNDAALDGDTLKVWLQLREKVVDHEIRLSPSPVDSWAVANLDAKFSSPTWAISVRDAVETCGITNIRIMEKISSAATNVLADYSHVPQKAARRLASSITLLTAVYYHGIADAPPLRELQMSASDGNTWQQFLKESNSTSQGDDGWLGIAQRLGVYGGSAFENSVINYLNAGWRKSAELDAAIKEIIASGDRSDASDILVDFLIADYWNYRLTKQERMEMAGRVAERCHLLDFGAMSKFLLQLDEIEGAESVFETAFKSWQAAQGEPRPPATTEDQFGRPLHPRMVEYLKRAAPALTLASEFEIFRRINFGNFSYSDLDRLEVISVDEYVMLIERASTDELRAMFPAMWRLRKTQFAGREVSPSADELFIRACQKLCKGPDRRLSNLIKSQLELASVPLEPEIG